MIYECGELFCPKCKASGLNIYTNWTSRVIFYGEKKFKQYIFYKKGQKIEKCNCFMCDKIQPLFCCNEDKSPCCFILFSLIFVLFYIALCFWVIDTIYCFLYPEEDEVQCWCNIGKDHIIAYCSKDKNIWENEKIPNKGLTERYWINKKNNFKDLFQCSKCFYNPNSFLPFIKKDEDNTLKVSDSQTIKVSDTKATNAIAINIIFNEGYFPIPCYPDDLFKDVLNKFFKVCPQYNLDNCYFLGSGQRLQSNLTISKNNIKNGENIQLHLINIDNNNDNNKDFNEVDNDYKAYHDMTD